MPHPDPGGLSLDEREDGSFTVTAEVWWHGNRRHRLARMHAVARNIARGGWRCWRCGTEIALSSVLTLATAASNAGRRPRASDARRASALQPDSGEVPSGAPR
jgi:hypothetical protein